MQEVCGLIGIGTFLASAWEKICSFFLGSLQVLFIRSAKILCNISLYIIKIFHLLATTRCKFYRV